VWVDETRPRNQGASLTAFELGREGIPHTVIADNAGGHLMQHGLVDLCITGTDRTAANGDVCNKIGTYALAVLARHHGVGFMVAAPTSTIDLKVATGAEIPIEERAADEVLTYAGKRLGPEGVDAHNPVFDVTPAALVDCIVTERGVIERPDAGKVRDLMTAAESTTPAGDS
jgi:methylthioribose-1-phosphate isomerase